ncbi:Formamidopyrimidine-DNA glycosylase [compost metagenome]
MGMFQHSLKIYGRKGESCVACGHPIEKTVVGGRGTHFCPACQPLIGTSDDKLKSAARKITGKTKKTSPRGSNDGSGVKG